MAVLSNGDDGDLAAEDDVDLAGDDVSVAGDDVDTTEVVDVFGSRVDVVEGQGSSSSPEPSSRSH